MEMPMLMSVTIWWPSILIRLDDGLADSPRQAGGVGRLLNLRHDDGEFIAAQTRDGIGFARAATQPLGDELQQFVADRMPERIVDTLELVEIEAKHRQALPAFHALEFVLEPFAQQRAIGQVCQGIVTRHVADALHGALLFGDVLVGGEPPGALDRRADQRNDAAIGELGDAVKGFPVP